MTPSESTAQALTKTIQLMTWKNSSAGYEMLEHIAQNVNGNACDRLQKIFCLCSHNVQPCVIDILSIK